VALIGLLLTWPLMFLIENFLQNEPVPPTMAWLLRPLATDPPKLQVLTVVAGFVLVLVLNALFVLDSYVNTKIDENMVLDFRRDLFRHAKCPSLSFRDQSRSGMLIKAINFQTADAAWLAMAVPPLAQSVLTLIGMVWISIQIDPRLSVLSLTVVPFLYYSVHFYVKHIQPRLNEVRAMEGGSLAITHEAMSMLRVTVAFGR